MTIPEIDRRRFIKQLSAILRQPYKVDVEELRRSSRPYRKHIKLLERKVKKPINERTGERIKESTLKQYRSQLSNDLKRENELKLLIMICEELGLLKSPCMKPKEREPQRLRRSRAKLKVLSGGLKTSRPF